MCLLCASKYIFFFTSVRVGLQPVSEKRLVLRSVSLLDFICSRLVLAF